jgi:hypothetical protein
MDFAEYCYSLPFVVPQAGSFVNVVSRQYTHQNQFSLYAIEMMQRIVLGKWIIFEEENNELCASRQSK